jgi:two-component system response regulator HydG
VWPELATDLEVDLSEVTAREPCPVTPDLAAVLVAAGGVERESMDWLSTRRPDGVPVFVVGADGDRRTATGMIQRGANDYFVMPEDVELMGNAIGLAVDHCRGQARAAAASVANGVDAFSQILGESPAIREALARAARALPHASSTALIVGETGTGKELLARALHEGGPRRGAPFVPVNCSALPANLAESELFGHERGAFTDAHAAKPGLFEIADGGTLFLDEVGTLSLDLQAKLLRALDDKELRRVGGTRSRTVDVRVLAATNENLEQAMRLGTFRNDLFYRLSVIQLELPPLRDRGDDAVVIARTLVRRLADHHGVPAPTLTPGDIDCIRRYPWPGNVRELRNLVERALLLSPPGEFRIHDVLPASSQPSFTATIPFPAALDDITLAAIRATLASCGGNRSEAARRLGVSRQRLRRLLQPGS